MGLCNSAVEEHMNALFGKSRADRIRQSTKLLKPEDRELSIVEAICEALKGKEGKYTLPFRFKK